MKITYLPANLDGAKRYLLSQSISSDDKVQDWIETRTIEALDTPHAIEREFGFVHRGLGFFWDRVGSTNGPSFGQEIPEEAIPEELSTDADAASIIQVTYWIAADAL